MSKTPVPLAEAIPIECARVRQILNHYRDIGPAGALGAMMIEKDLAEMGAASASGDLVRMIRAYKILQEIQD